MTEGLQPPPRVLGVGIPERLRTDFLANLPGAVLADNVSHAAAVLSAHPAVPVAYGEITFGAVVSGQTVYLKPEQEGDGLVASVLVVVDRKPESLAELEWDDPCRLAGEAGVRLKAKYLVNVSQPGAWLALDVLLDELLANPPK